jgi:electron-transferring-flavoprotein dehydrogenase
LTRAEALGVEIHPGFAAIELLYGGNGEVVGIATRDMGIAPDGRPKAGFTRRMEPIRQIVLLAEGVRGSLSRQAVSRCRLDSVSGPPHLNYKNPTLSPFDKFQPFKTYLLVRRTFAGAKRLAYGAGRDRSRLAACAEIVLSWRCLLWLFSRICEFCSHKRHL